MSEALETLMSAAKAGLAVASNRPVAKADRVCMRLQRADEDCLNICELDSEMPDLISDQGREERWEGKSTKGSDKLE